MPATNYSSERWYRQNYLSSSYHNITNVMILHDSTVERTMLINLLDILNIDLKSLENLIFL